MKAKIISKYCVSVIDYDKEVKKVESVFSNKINSMGIDDNSINNILAKKEDDRTIEDLKKIVLRKNINDWKDDRMSELNGYKDYIPEDPPKDLKDFESVIPYYEEDDNNVIQKWEIKENDKFKMLQRINVLKKELSDSDYKVIKCYEASLMNKDMPYDLQTLISERNSKREEINDIQSKMN